MRRRTRPQTGLTRNKRLANVRGAFKAPPHPDLAGSRVLLIDDVMTTGATAGEAARSLRKAGAAEVVVAILARAKGSADALACRLPAEQRTFPTIVLARSLT